MKVAIVTITDKNPNYGNKLQNYASVKIMESYKLEVETLLTESQEEIPDSAKKLTGPFAKKSNLTEEEVHSLKLLHFNEFQKKFLYPNSKLLETTNVPNYFNYFVVGSDQVWNPVWYTELKLYAFMLTFAYPNQKICMAPSFGLQDIPADWHEHFGKWLKEFPNLSVREESGAKIIKEITGQDAEVVIDPTLMLEAKEYRKIAKKSKARKSGKKYILKYMLGEQTDEYRHYIEQLASEKGYEIYELMDIHQPDVYEAGPLEFLDLVDNAQLICTDDYYGAAFSIIFEKPMLLALREEEGKPNLNAPLEHLVEKMKLQDRMYPGIAGDQIFTQDYSETKEILKAEQKKGWDFLTKSLNIRI